MATPISPYATVGVNPEYPSTYRVEQIDGAECVISNTNDCSFRGSESTYLLIERVLQDLGERALSGGFKRSQVAIPVYYPDGKVALLCATFDLGAPLEIPKH